MAYTCEVNNFFGLSFGRAGVNQNAGLSGGGTSFYLSNRGRGTGYGSFPSILYGNELVDDLIRLTGLQNVIVSSITLFSESVNSYHPSAGGGTVVYADGTESTNLSTSGNWTGLDSPVVDYYFKFPRLSIGYTHEVEGVRIAASYILNPTETIRFRTANEFRAIFRLFGFDVPDNPDWNHTPYITCVDSSSNTTTATVNTSNFPMDDGIEVTIVDGDPPETPISQVVNIRTSRAEIMDGVLNTIGSYITEPTVSIVERHPDGRVSASISSEDLNFVPPLTLIFNDYDHMIAVLQKACYQDGYKLGRRNLPTEAEWDG